MILIDYVDSRRLEMEQHFFVFFLFVCFFVYFFVFVFGCFVVCCSNTPLWLLPMKIETCLISLNKYSIIGQLGS